MVRYSCIYLVSFFFSLRGKVKLELYLTSSSLIDIKLVDCIPSFLGSSGTGRIIDVLKDFNGDGGVDPCKK